MREWEHKCEAKQNQKWGKKRKKKKKLRWLNEWIPHLLSPLKNEYSHHFCALRNSTNAKAIYLIWFFIETNHLHSKWFHKLNFEKMKEWERKRMLWTIVDRRFAINNRVMFHVRLICSKGKPQSRLAVSHAQYSYVRPFYKLYWKKKCS